MTTPALTWTHRIDDVPAPGRFVWIRTVAGVEAMATVKHARIWPGQFAGVGADREYHLVNGTVVPAEDMTHWAVLPKHAPLPPGASAAQRLLRCPGLWAELEDAGYDFS